MQSHTCTLVQVWDRLKFVKRSAVLKTLRKAAKGRGLDVEVTELTRHTAIRVGHVTRTLGRHTDIDEITVAKFFDQFAEVLGGKGWWR